MDIHFSCHWKRPWCREKSRQEEKGMTEDERVGWHQRLDGHDFEQAPGDGAEQGSLTCCSPWGCKELDTTEQLNNIFHIISNFLVFWVPSGSISLGSLVLLTNQNLTWFLLLLNSVILYPPAVVHLGRCLHTERSRSWTGFLLFQNFALVQNCNSPPHL